MSEYFQATVDIKKKIESIGKRQFTLSDDWLKKSPPLQDYSANILQAVWNIVHTIQVATKEKFPKWYLLNKKSDFTKWFHYLEAVTGTPRINDDTSYQLGCALHIFLDITITNSDAQNILTSGIAKLIGIDPMKKLTTSSKLLIDDRLPAYVALQMSEIAAQSKPTTPSFIDTTTDAWTYKITLSTDVDSTTRAETDSNSYQELINQLQTYTQQLAVQQKQLEEKQKEFLAIVDPRSVDRFCQYKDLVKPYNDSIKQHKNAVALLTKAKKALHTTKSMLVKDSTDQQEILASLTRSIEETFSIAESSSEQYMAAKRTAEATPPSHKDNLSNIEANAARRRLSLQEMTTVLKTFVDVPEAASGQSTIKKSILESFRSSSINTELNKLLKVIQQKLDEIETELKIDVTLTETTEPEASTPAVGTLYALQKQYQEEKKHQTAHNLVPLAELQSCQDRMKYSQATLLLSITTLEFSLKTLLERLQVDGVLDCKVDPDTTTEINEWLKTTALKQQSTQKLRDAFLAQQTQWCKLDELYTKIPVGIPIHTSTTKATLLQEYQTLDARIKAVEDQYQQLQALVDKPQAPLPTPLLDEEHCPTLSIRFFGTTQEEIGGVFGEYIKERANTYWFRDLFSQFTALIFGCCAYQTEAAARVEFITNLKGMVKNYPSDQVTYSDLETFIDGGLKTFSPRAKSGNDYQKSLHYKLSTYKEGLLAEVHVLPTMDAGIKPGLRLQALSGYSR